VKQSCAARPDGELSNTTGIVWPAVGILRRESLVDVVVAVDDDINTELVQNRPQRLYGGGGK